MQIETLGARKFAFGLKWVEAANTREGVIASAYGFEDERPAHIFLSRAPGDGSTDPIGVGDSTDRVKGRVYSAAAAVASTGKDGFFVMPLDCGDKLWFVGIRNSAVVARTDVIMGSETQLAAVSRLAEASQLPVYLDDTLAGTPVAVAFQGCELVDVAGGIAHTSIKPMLSAERSLWLAAVVVAVVMLAVLGGVGLYFYKASGGGQSAESAAAQRQQRIQTYVTGAKKAIGEYPKDSGWALAAMREAERRLPPYIAGWAITKVECLPSACMAEYQHSGADGYAVSPVVDLFGQANVAMTQLGQRLTVKLPLSTKVLPVDQGWLRSLRPARVGYADWLGRIPETMLGGRTASPTPTVDLGKKNQGQQAGMPPLFMDQVVVIGNAYLDTATLGAIVNKGTIGGFRVTRFAWSCDPNAPAWQVTWSRVHG